MTPFDPTAEVGLGVLQRCYQNLKAACRSPSNASEARTTSYSTSVEDLNILIGDLVYQDSDPFPGPQIELSQAEPSHPDTSFALEPSPHIFQTLRDCFNQT